jgi:DNA-binding transcriptional MerR regulator
MNNDRNALASGNTNGYFRPSDAARFLNISPQHLQRLRSQGLGPPFKKISKNIVLYSREDLITWFRNLGRCHRSGGLKP